ncbi:MAG TPA: hypothetical protein VMH86_12080 [Rhizomicrobium sp.]|nr:hypothetical protein [Rhizomicrobium sp.]
MTVPQDKWISTTGEHDWTDAGSWSAGVVPDATYNVFMTLNAAPFQADVTTAVAMHDFQFSSPKATLNETDAGSMTARNVTFLRGNVILAGANTFHSTDIVVATVEALNASAFGSGAISMTNAGGVLLAGGDITLKNSFTVSGGEFAALPSHTLILDGTMEVDATPAGAFVTFGDSGDGDTGTVEVAGKGFTLSGGGELGITVSAGTVTSGTGARDIAATDMFGDATFVAVDSGATLDLTHFGTSLTLDGLTGQGTVETTGGLRTVGLSDADFSGTFAGRMNFLVTGDSTLTGAGIGSHTITFGSGTDTLDLSGAHGEFIVSAPAGADAEIKVGHGDIQTMKFTDFQLGHLTIDTLDPSSSVVTFHDHATSVTASINPKDGTPIYTLTFAGVSSHDGFVTGTDGHGHLEITYSTAEAHAALHDAAVESAAASASYVPVHDGF